MYRVRNWLLLPGLLFLGSLLMLLRYILKTPQPLVSLLPGDDHLYKWTHGQIFYKVHGNRDAPPLLLLHAPGIGASAYEMLSIMESLAPHYRIYAPDLLGFGLSDAPAIDYNADVFVALCRDFLRDVVQQPATLLGRGLSCAYALAVAARSPELCSQLVLLSPDYSDGPDQSRPYPSTALSAQTRSITPLPTNHAPTLLQPLQAWLSGLISQSPLFGTFLYALLTPRIILRQVMQFQSDQKPVTTADLNYTFAAAHQLGAQYAALAFITHKLNLDVTLEAPLQPALLLWNTPPPINSVTQYYMSLPHVQALFLSHTHYHLHEATPLNVASAILEWQDRRRKELPVAVETKNATSVPKNITSSEAENPIAKMVENSQPTDLQMEPTSATLPTPVTVDAFCVKCKQKRTMNDPRKIVTRNGRSAMEGRCPVCDTKLFRFVSS